MLIFLLTTTGMVFFSLKYYYKNKKKDKKSKITTGVAAATGEGGGCRGQERKTHSGTQLRCGTTSQPRAKLRHESINYELLSPEVLE